MQVARITFNQQLALFEKTIGLEFSPFFQDQQELSDYLAKSIYMVVFGSNDYINNYLMPKLYPSSKLYDPHTYGQILVRVLTQQLKVPSFLFFPSLISIPSIRKNCC